MFDELSLPLIQKKKLHQQGQLPKDDKVKLLRTQTKPHKPYPNQDMEIYQGYRNRYNIIEWGY